MTAENYNKAKDIVLKMDALDNKIKQLQKILDCDYDVSWWRIDVRRSSTYPSENIEHYGLLREFLQMIQKENIKRYEALQEEFKEL